MRTPEGTATVLFGRARQKVLGWLVTHPGDAYFLREIARHSRLAPSTVQRELTQLVKAGLVTRWRSGHQVYFRADEASPVFREVQSLFVKTSAMADVLRNALRPLRSRIESAYLVGAVVRGELRNSSPVDLLAIGDVEPDEVMTVLSRAQDALGRHINVRTHRPDDRVPPDDPYVILFDKTG